MTIDDKTKSQIKADIESVIKELMILVETMPNWINTGDTGIDIGDSNLSITYSGVEGFTLSAANYIPGGGSPYMGWYPPDVEVIDLSSHAKMRDAFRAGLHEIVKKALDLQTERENDDAEAAYQREVDEMCRKSRERGSNAK